MPRAISGAGGLKVVGVYAALLDLERERSERDDRRSARMIAAEGFCYRRGRLLAQRLAAGESVVLDCATVELALWYRNRQRARLPFGREARRRVQVSADDRILPVVVVDLDEDDDDGL